MIAAALPYVVSAVLLGAGVLLLGRGVALWSALRRRVRNRRVLRRRRPAPTIPPAPRRPAWPRPVSPSHSETIAEQVLAGSVAPAMTQQNPPAAADIDQAAATYQERIGSDGQAPATRAADDGGRAPVLDQAWGGLDGQATATPTTAGVAQAAATYQERAGVNEQTAATPTGADLGLAAATYQERVGVGAPTAASAGSTGVSSPPAPVVEVGHPAQASVENRAALYPALANPQVQLNGTVDDAMYQSFREQLTSAPAGGPLVVSITTLGGDPEVARAMGDDIRLLREYTGRETLFLGKVAVYSAGATFMSAFPVHKRFLTRGTRLMLHERLMNSDLTLSGPLKTLSYTLKAKLHEIEHSILIEEEGFRDLVAGSDVSFEELQAKAPSNWYIDAEEARARKLVLDII